MRAILAKAVWLLGLVAGLAAAAGWGYFIWSFDWGNSYRGRGLWMMALYLPALLGFFAVFFAVFFVLSMVWEFIFREKFPPL
jgi:hypothetical protein